MCNNLKFVVSQYLCMLFTYINSTYILSALSISLLIFEVTQVKYKTFY